MATASHFITRALIRLGVKTAEAPLEPSELQDGLDLLNDLMALWGVDGTLPGAAPVADAQDELRAPRYAHAAIIPHLAILMAPEYSKTVELALAAAAEDAMNGLLRLTVNIGEVEYPSTLPIGSGNECSNFNIERRFFPENTKENF